MINVIVYGLLATVAVVKESAPFLFQTLAQLNTPAVSLTDEEKHLKNKISKINSILDSFKAEIDNIGVHKAEAKVAATEMYDKLNDYAKTLSYKSEQKDWDAFFKNVELTVNEYLPTLEQDLGWGDYLKNILKAMGNVVLSVTTLGQVNGFFKPVHADAVAKAVDLHVELADLDDAVIENETALSA